jgi:hypothetical protein
MIKLVSEWKSHMPETNGYMIEQPVIGVFKLAAWYIFMIQLASQE